MRALVPQLVAFLGVCLLAAPAMSQNWSQFRGANQNGVVEGAELPIEWGPDNQVLWKVKLPGIGWSQPIVWGDKIFVTTAESDKQSKPDPKNTGPGVGGYTSLFSGGTINLPPPSATYRCKVLCLDSATGKIVWEQTAREGRPTIPIHANNTYASETPSTDGDRLVACFGMMGIYCYDLSGNQLWKKDFGVRRMQFGWGTASSPIMFGNNVYIQCDNEEASFLAALNKTNGDVVWKVDREEKSNWSTPYVWRNKVRTELVAAGGDKMCSYDPKSGEPLWSMKGSGRTATTPVGDADLLYVDSYDRLTGAGGALAAIRPGATGDISLAPNETSSLHVAWTAPVKGNRFASPIISQGCLYVFSQGSGIIYCFDAKTGQQHYRKRLPGAAGFAASALANGEHIYCVDQNCQTTIIKGGPEHQVVATNVLGEMCWASPAVAGDRVLLRTIDHLYAIGQK